MSPLLSLSILTANRQQPIANSQSLTKTICHTLPPFGTSVA